MCTLTENGTMININPKTKDVPDRSDYEKRREDKKEANIRGENYTDKTRDWESPYMRVADKKVRQCQTSHKKRNCRWAIHTGPCKPQQIGNGNSTPYSPSNK